MPDQPSDHPSDAEPSQPVGINEVRDRRTERMLIESVNATNQLAADLRNQHAELPEQLQENNETIDHAIQSVCNGMPIRNTQWVIAGSVACGIIVGMIVVALLLFAAGAVVYFSEMPKYQNLPAAQSP